MQRGVGIGDKVLGGGKGQHFRDVDAPLGLFQPVRRRRGGFGHIFRMVERIPVELKRAGFILACALLLTTIFAMFIEEPIVVADVVNQVDLIDLLDIVIEALVAAVDIDLHPGAAAGDKAAAGSLIDVPGQTFRDRCTFASVFQTELLFACEQLPGHISIDVDFQRDLLWVGLGRFGQVVLAPDSNQHRSDRAALQCCLPIFVVTIGIGDALPICTGSNQIIPVARVHCNVECQDPTGVEKIVGIGVVGVLRLC